MREARPRGRRRGTSWLNRPPKTIRFLRRTWNSNDGLIGPPTGSALAAPKATRGSMVRHHVPEVQLSQRRGKFVPVPALHGLVERTPSQSPTPTALRDGLVSASIKFYRGALSPTRLLPGRAAPLASTAKFVCGYFSSFNWVPWEFFARYQYYSGGGPKGFRDIKISALLCPRSSMIEPPCMCVFPEVLHDCRLIDENGT